MPARGKTPHHRLFFTLLVFIISSRSHSIFTIHVHLRELAEARTDLIISGKFNLVDLAGTEKISRSGATGQQAEEAKNINLSLLTLIKIISLLAQVEQMNIFHTGTRN